MNGVVLVLCCHVLAQFVRTIVERYCTVHGTGRTKNYSTTFIKVNRYHRLLLGTLAKKLSEFRIFFNCFLGASKEILQDDN